LITGLAVFSVVLGYIDSDWKVHKEGDWDKKMKILKFMNFEDT